ncbi:ABC transporter permease [Bacillus sp. 1P10SD]|uniref:ABC transporter permease n=1 Tax=Bacillus sp. 1P10SD TaxID=3132265 RepID=UPI0039A4C8A4
MSQVLAKTNQSIDINSEQAKLAKKRKRNEILRQFSLLSILALLIILFSFAADSFFSMMNFSNILRQVAVTTIAAIGVFMIILLGDIDLSVGSLYALIGVMAALVWEGTGSTILTLIAALVVGAVIGFGNGFVTAKGKIPSFVTTLAMMGIARGIAYIVTNGTPIGIVEPGFTMFGTGFVGNIIPIPVIIMIIVFVLAYILINNTRFGRYIYAVGGNDQASHWSGLNTTKIRVIVFTLAGLLYGLSSIILAGRLGGALPTAGQGAELDAITAVILGGTSLSGGKGKISGVLIGCLIIGVLNNGLDLIGLSSYWQQVIKGIIIIVAVLYDTKSKNKN